MSDLGSIAKEKRKSEIEESRCAGRDSTVSVLSVVSMREGLQQDGTTTPLDDPPHHATRSSHADVTTRNSSRQSKRESSVQKRTKRISKRKSKTDLNGRTSIPFTDEFTAVAPIEDHEERKDKRAIVKKSHSRPLEKKKTGSLCVTTSARVFDQAHELVDNNPTKQCTRFKETAEEMPEAFPSHQHTPPDILDDSAPSPSSAANAEVEVPLTKTPPSCQVSPKPDAARTDVPGFQIGSERGVPRTTSKNSHRSGMSTLSGRGDSPHRLPGAADSPHHRLPGAAVHSEGGSL